MKVVAVIPARFASTRLPAKPLADIHGKPMIQWVYERVSQAKSLESVYVATDDERIAEKVRAFGGNVLLTDPELQSGTDRVAAAAEVIPADIYVNVQGDEPLMDPRAVDAAVELITQNGFTLSTVMTPIQDASDLDNPAVVKVIVDRNNRAIYFSRYPIPYSRGPRPTSGEDWACRRHVGLYAYTRKALFDFRALPPSPLERGESLEQLRALGAGVPIGIKEVDFISIGVDTPEELEKARKLLQK